MWTKLCLIAVAASLALGADHNTFKNCSEIPICRDRRGLERAQRYDAVAEGASFHDGVATINLISLVDGGEDAVLLITAIEGGIFRVLIEEVNSQRYHLKNILDGEPTAVPFDNVGIFGEALFTLYLGDSKVDIRASPLTIEFYYKDVLELVLEGDRLSLENTEDSQAFTFSLNYPQSLRLYGLHEHAESLSLQSTKPGGTDPYRIRNLDVANYELNSPMALYGSIPVLYGHGTNITSGVFLHNAAEAWVETTNLEDTGSESFWIVKGGVLDLFVLTGPRPDNIVRQYAKLTGVAHLPQIWTLGYHQCRWGYKDTEDVKTVIADFDNYDFPIDVIWLDIQHTDDKKFFTWNPQNFSDPIEMLNNLSSTHRYLVTLTDPHFKKEVGYFVYDQALEKDLFVKTANGSVFEGECWPGISSYMDYLNPATQEYYASLYSYDVWTATPALGGIWNDMNEPSVFDDSLEKTFPDDNMHYGNVMHRDIHNIYGLLQTNATYQGLIARDNRQFRPFILTRSHFAGSQRIAAIWTGDNTADWPWIPFSWSMCLNANILGISFCGSDVGGFFDDIVSVEFLERFYQSGAWMPFFRAHASIDSARREPYLFDEDVQAVLRASMKQRYAHIPVYYTLFFEHQRTGEPVIRPLFYHYPEDAEVLDIDNQILVGRDILVKQIAEPNVTLTQVYFPGGEDQVWYSIYDTTAFRGTGWTDIPVTLDWIPTYYRGGAVIATKAISRPSTTDMKDDPYTVYVVVDQNLAAQGTLYNDDTFSFEYLDNLAYNYVNITYNNGDIAISTIDLSNPAGFEIVIDSFVYIGPQMAADGCFTGNYIKTVHKNTADGIPVSSFKFGRESVSFSLAV